MHNFFPESPATPEKPVSPSKTQAANSVPTPIIPQFVRKRYFSFFFSQRNSPKQLKFGAQSIRLTIIDDLVGSNSLNSPLIDFTIHGMVVDASNWSSQVKSSIFLLLKVVPIELK
jgi:hypothetical protein